METPRTSTPSTLTTDVHHQSSRYQRMPDHLADVSKVNNCARELTAAVNQLLDTTKWDIERVRQETMMTMEERLQNLESEKAGALHRLREMEEKYDRLEDVVLEKDEEIRQNRQVWQSAEEKIRNLEHGRRLAISVAEETQQNATMVEAWATEQVTKARQDEEVALQKVAMSNQSEATVHRRARQLQEEKDSAVNARNIAESRAEDAEQARKEAEKRAEQAERAKALAEERAKGLESNEACMISSRRQAETRAEKAEADLAAAVEREKETRRTLETMTSIDQTYEATIHVKRPKEKPTNPNKISRLYSSTARKRRVLRGLETACHDERLKDLAQDLNRVVEDWGMEEERYALFTFTTASIEVFRVEKGRDTSESSLLVRCARHAEEVVITVFSVVSLACMIYGADLDPKAAVELLRAYIFQTASRRHARNLYVGEESERVTLFAGLQRFITNRIWPR